MQRVLSVHLLHKLTCNGLVRHVRVGPGSHVERRVLQYRDVRAEVPNELSGELALFGNSGGELSRIILDVLSRGSRLLKRIDSA